jgi:hypothetical protein
MGDDGDAHVLTGVGATSDKCIVPLLKYGAISSPWLLLNSSEPISLSLIDNISVLADDRVVVLQMLAFIN